MKSNINITCFISINIPNIFFWKINNIYKANLFLFGYCFAGSQKSVGSKLVVTIIADGQEIKEEFDVLHGEELRFYSKELSQYTNVSIKVEHIDEWSTDTYLDIFMVTVYAKPSEKDLQEWVISNTPTKLSKSTFCRASLLNLYQSANTFLSFIITYFLRLRYQIILSFISMLFQVLFFI